MGSQSGARVLPSTGGRHDPILRKLLALNNCDPVRVCGGPTTSAFQCGMTPGNTNKDLAHMQMHVHLHVLVCLRQQHPIHVWTHVNQSEGQ
jgi:hypothetical protein